MARTLRFHLDECDDLRLAAGLRHVGIDVTTTPETGMRGKTDEEQLAFAVANNRVLITGDTDFLALARSGHEHLGIVYFHPGRRSIGQIVNFVRVLWEMDDAEAMRNRVEYV